MTTLLVLEQCGITPPLPLGTVTLPLTFFDMIWLYFHPIRRLLFYEYPCSKDHFLETLVPNLKNSLSLALEHYYPLASNLLCPLSTEAKPMFRYVDGNSVSLTTAESKDDFDYLTANHARDASRFYPLVPELPPPKEELEYEAIPVLRVQVTLFSNRGVSIGFTNHHAIGDASSIVGFIKAWARINNTQLTEEKSLPLFDRSVIKDSRGVGDIWWDQLKKVKFLHPSSLSSCLPMDTVRATYVVSQSDIQKLKDIVLAEKPGLQHPTSFVVASAYVWTCFVRSGPASGEEVDADTQECFAFAADYRARLDPRVPANYFGNCIGGGWAEIKHGELILEEKHLHGFVIAAEAIAEVIRVKLNKKEQNPEKWLDGARELIGKRVLSVSGSPKFDLYSANYGWGRPKKLETVSIDGDSAISLCKSRDSEGGLEVGLSLPKIKMDAFAVIFTNGLRAFH